MTLKDFLLAGRGALETWELEEHLHHWISNHQDEGVIWVTMRQGNQRNQFGLMVGNIEKIELKEQQT